MKRIFTFAIALMSLLAASAANVTFTVTVPFNAAVPATQMTYECWIVGSFNGWNNNDKKMTKVDDTHYTITMDDATWAAGVTADNVEYKYLSGGGDWAYVEKDAAGAELAANRKYTDNNGVDVVATWAAVYNPNVAPLPMDVEIMALTPAGTLECYIAGNFNGWVGPTAPNCQMTKVSTEADGTVIFSITIHTDDANKLAYNLCSGPDWSYQQLAPSGDFKYPEVNPVVTEWKKLYDPANVGTIVVTATVPAGTANVWSVGSFQGWSMDNAVLCTKNADGTFSFTVTFTGGFEYKLFNKQDASWGYYAVDALVVAIPNTVVSYPADVDSHVTVVAWKQEVNGISDVKAAENLMYSSNSRIVVEGVVNEVSVLDLAGRNVQTSKMNGTFTSKTLNAGLYIIRVDGATRKLAVR